MTVLATYLVSRMVLSTSSDVYEDSFRWNSERVLEVEDELWFRILHGATSEEIENLQDPSILDIWEALHVCEWRDLDIDKLKPWFNEWMKKKDYKQLTDNEIDELMTPYYMLDHARAFAWITKKKVYDSENHIHESNSSRHSYLHLRHNVIGIKSAQKVAAKVQFEFHGLCLDCVDASKVTTRTNGNPRRANEDEDGLGMSTSDQAYWEHDRKGEWSLNCRIDHGQPTWYFSFMGRPSSMNMHRKKMKEDK
ncbi:hypothetical protein BPAE_0002g00120 [Botrytis paeoniae]|uniref:Uncharacterized protein n=1 Tax=Botrytis paeoniae TaxID=278948 RepID=A0A4Z1G686_9HELO|nr:hypothetical protein BPAE_0002g00120 [Botrytis paeoniae]